MYGGGWGGVGGEGLQHFVIVAFPGHIHFF